MKARTARPADKPAPAAPATATGYELDAQIGFLLRKAHQRATETFNQVMAEFDVTPMQFAALAKVHDLGSVSQNQLGRLIAMDPATTFGVVGRLMKRGLVSQHTDARDARLVLIELTEAGRALVVAMKASGLDVSTRTLSPLTSDEAATLLALLARIG